MSRPELSIIVPVFNEERTIATVMRAIKERCPGAELIYVDDGSHDQSLSILREHADPGDIVLTKENGGKGSAIRIGLKHATGVYTAIQDADLEYDPGEIMLLLKEAKEHPGSAVFGSRFLKKSPNIYRRFLLGNKVMTWWLNVLFRSHITDSYTCFKLIPTQQFQSFPLHARGFELEAELCIQCIINRIPIREIFITYRPRRIEEGKKISWHDAWYGMWTILKMRFQRFIPLVAASSPRGTPAQH